MVVSGHWLDHEWNMNSVALDFKTFPTPHSRLATTALIGHVILDWDLEQWLLLIITDDTSYILIGIKLLFDAFKG